MYIGLCVLCKPHCDAISVTPIAVYDFNFSAKIRKPEMSGVSTFCFLSHTALALIPFHNPEIARLLSVSY